MDKVCPNCGGEGVGMLGIHEWQDPASGYWRSQAEYGTPCPNCGVVATKEQLEAAGIYDSD